MIEMRTDVWEPGTRVTRQNGSHTRLCLYPLKCGTHLTPNGFYTGQSPKSLAFRKKAQRVVILAEVLHAIDGLVCFV